MRSRFASAAAAAWVALVLPASLLWTACGDDVFATNPGTNPDAAAASDTPGSGGDAKIDAGSLEASSLDAGLCDGSCATCAAILAAAPSTVSGVYMIDPDGVVGPQPPFNAFCDMGTDEGGWTLLISLAPTTYTQNFNAPAAWPTTVSTSPGPPMTSGLYQGTLAPFHDVREEIASAGVTVYGRNKTLAELETIRKQYGWATRPVSAPTYPDRPACRESYAATTDSIVGCANYGGTTSPSVIGWAQDPDSVHSNGCWFGRGNIGAAGSDAGGSSQCDGDVNSMRWARTWFR